MTEIFVGWFLFAGVMVIATVVFTGWVIAKVARGLGRTLGLLPPKPSRMASPQRRAFSAPPQLPQSGSMQCRIAGCRHLNPTTAKFCRHCGHAFPQFQSVPARQVAVYR